MNLDLKFRFVFVIDTENYSGNFEREICGYLTARYDQEDGGDTHGSAESAIAESELPKKLWLYFEEHVIDCLEEPDDLPIHTPVTIYPTPGWYNNGRGKHIQGTPSQEEMENCYLNKAWPCYQSVGIFFDERPSDETIRILKERAEKFARDYWPKREYLGHEIKITGFRLLKEEIKVTASEEKV